MSKYAKINSENIVENIIVCEDSVISSLNGTYIKVTDFTNNAEIGCEYVKSKEKFKEFQHFNSWTLDEETLKYVPPIEKPGDNYDWNEVEQVWVQREL